MAAVNLRIPEDLVVRPTDGFAVRCNKFGATLYFGERVTRKVETVNVKSAIYVSPESLRVLVALLTTIAATYEPRTGVTDVPDAFKDGWEKN